MRVSRLFRTNRSSDDVHRENADGERDVSVPPGGICPRWETEDGRGRVQLRSGAGTQGLMGNVVRMFFCLDEQTSIFVFPGFVGDSNGSQSSGE